MRRVFRARGKLVGTSDFVVTKGYVQIRVVGFPRLRKIVEFRALTPRSLARGGCRCLAAFRLL